MGVDVILPDMALYDTLRLYISNDAYHLVPESGGDLAQTGLGTTLIFNRRTNEITTRPTLDPPTTYDSALLVYGFFGLVSLLRSDYLIFVTSRKRVSKVLDADVYLARDFKVFPMDPSLSAKALGQSMGLHRPNEAFLLSLIKGHLYSGPFYFTYGGYDLTSRMQAQDPNDKRALFERADDRFFWNKHLQTRLIDLAENSRGVNIGAFILPVLFGFCTIKTASINSRDFIFGVISRRSRFRAGTRYFSRGIDQDGNVSNFNETEQFVVLDGPDSKGLGPVRGDVRASYAQIRGSVPIYWAEVN